MGQYHELYHQAGLMIRIDDQNWIKAGIEFLNGKQSVSAVGHAGVFRLVCTSLLDNPRFSLVAHATLSRHGSDLVFP